MSTEKKNLIDADISGENVIMYKDDKIIKEEIISDDKKYRYRFSYTWDGAKPKVLFILLNPATDEENNSPQKIHRTRKRLINFAKSWGYGGFMVGNLFAFRAQKPKHLLEKGLAAVGSENQKYLVDMANECEKVVCAWGNRRIVHELLGDKGIEFLFSPPFKNKLQYLKLLEDDITPGHPLYLNGDLKPKEFSPISYKR